MLLRRKFFFSWREREGPLQGRLPFKKETTKGYMCWAYRDQNLLLYTGKEKAARQKRTAAHENATFWRAVEERGGFFPLEKGLALERADGG